MTQGELDTAIRRALNIFDSWNNVTGVIVQHSGYYHEIQGCIEDAVHCGAQAASGDYRQLDAEADLGWLVPNPEDCCRELTRVWRALGIDKYNGKSAAENVTQLRQQLATAEAEQQAKREG